jgi:hypothetical protein
MHGWKVAAATPLLLVPLAVLGISIADGTEHKAETPAMVLPAAAVEGPRVTMRREEPPRRGREGDDTNARDPAPSGTPAPQTPPSQAPPTDPVPDQDCDDHDHNDDGDDDRDDDGVEFVHPCPGAVGDDEDDDDDDGDD